MPGPNRPSPAPAPARRRALQPRPPRRQCRMANPATARGQNPHGGTDRVSRTPATTAGPTTAGSDGREEGKWAMRHPRRRRSGRRLAAELLGSLVVAEALVARVAKGTGRGPLAEVHVTHQPGLDVAGLAQPHRLG